MEEKRNQAQAEEDLPKENERVGLNEIGAFDTDLYTGGKSKFEGYHTSLALDEADDDADDDGQGPQANKRATYTAPLALLNDVAQSDNDYDPFAEHKRPKIADREDEYRQRKRNQIISPARVDPFANGGATPDVGARGYSQIMREQALRSDEVDFQRQMKEKAKDGSLKIVAQAEQQAPKVAPKRRGRWDMTTDDTPSKTMKKSGSTTPTPSGGDTSTTPAHLQPWDATPGRRDLGGETPGAGAQAASRMWDPTPAHATTPGHHGGGGGSETPAAGAATPGRRNRWDETPRTERETPGHGAGWAETPRTDRQGGGEKIISETPTPSASKRRSRWDETPSATPTMSGAATPTPSGGDGAATPSSSTPSMTPGGTPSRMMTPSMSTPMGAKAMGMATPSPSQMMQMTPEQLQAFRWEQEIDQRNRPLSDDELDQMFPPGYKVLQPPAGYIPIRTPARKLTATPTPMAGMTPTGFYMQPDTPGGDRSGKFMDNQPKGNNIIPKDSKIYLVIQPTAL
jgi:splicing factor 3B subunit 1